MMRVARVALVGVCLGWVTVGFGGAPDAKEVLEKAQAALKALPAISYEARFRDEGASPQPARDVTGTATLVRGSTAVPVVRIDAAVSGGEKGSPRFQLACDGTSAVLIDHQQKLYLRRPASDRTLFSSPPMLLALTEYLKETPFADVPPMTALARAEDQSADGVDCYVIRMQFSGGVHELRWFIGKADFLPRRMEETMKWSGGEARSTLTIQNLNLKPDVRTELFRLEQPAGYSAGPPGRPQMLAAGAVAPDWSLKTPDGKTVALKDLRGKVVLLDFWATWCPPCKASMPGIQKIAQRFKDKPVVVYGVSTWKRANDDPPGYMKQMKYTYGLLLDGDAAALAYGVAGIPSFFVIGHDGKIVYSGSGSGQDEDIVRAIERALGQMK